MKSLKLKVLTIGLALLSSITTAVFAEDIVIPVVSKPRALQEGIQRDLTSDQVAQLIPWAKNSKLELKELLESVKQLNTEDKIEKLVIGIESIIEKSAQKNSELLMRYVLNRALVINKELSEEMDSLVVGSMDVKLRVLSTSITMALDYSDDDVTTLNTNNKIRYAMFGKVYYSFLYELNKSIFDASAQYKILKTALEWYQWDLYRDLDNNVYAAYIVKINNILKQYPKQKAQDTEAMAFVRQLKNFSVSAGLNDKMLVHKEISSRIKRSKEKFEVGDRVYAFPGTAIEGVISKVADDDRYDFISDSGKKYKRVPRSYFYEMQGCSDTFCINDELRYTSFQADRKEGEEVIVVGVSYRDDYVVKNKLTGKLSTSGHYGLNMTKGCRGNFCVGDKSTIKNTDEPVEIVVIGAEFCGVKYLDTDRYISHFYGIYDLSISCSQINK